MSLPVALSSAGLARWFLQDHWCGEHDSADLAQAQLIVTELVTNAVRHGGPPIELQMECLGTGGVMLSVSDGTPDVPVAQAEDHARWGGHGVALVDLLSAEWGVHQHLEHRRQHHPDRDLVGNAADDPDDPAHGAHDGRRQQAGTLREHPGHQLSASGYSTPAKTVWCRLVG